MTFHDTYPSGVDVAIRATVPGYTEAVAARDALQKLPPPVAGDHHLADLEVGSRLRDLAVAGDLTSESALEAARQVQADYAAVSLLSAGTRAALELASQEISTADTHSTAFLHGYSSAFGVLTADLDDLEPLEEITTLAKAVAAGRAEDHPRLQHLLDAYGSIRRQHLKVLTNTVSVEYPEAAVFPDVTAHFPHWAAWHDGGELVRRDGAGTAPIRPPWPSRGMRSPNRPGDGVRSRDSFTSDAARPEFLLWARKASAVLWMPDAAAFEEAQGHLDAASAPSARPDDGESEWVDPAVKAARFPERREVPLSVKLSKAYQQGGPIPLGGS